MTTQREKRKTGWGWHLNRVLFGYAEVWGRRQAPEGNSEVKWSKRTYRGGRPPRSKLMVGETDRKGLQKKVRISHQKEFHVNQRNTDFVPWRNWNQVFTEEWQDQLQQWWGLLLRSCPGCFRTHTLTYLALLWDHETKSRESPWQRTPHNLDLCAQATGQPMKSVHNIREALLPPENTKSP